MKRERDKNDGMNFIQTIIFGCRQMCEERGEQNESQ